MNSFHDARVKIVRKGESHIFQNWHKHADISMDEFLDALEWLDADPEDGIGGKMTRELGCTKEGLFKLKRSYDEVGEFCGFYMADGYEDEYKDSYAFLGNRWIGRVSISCRDHI